MLMQQNVEEEPSTAPLCPAVKLHDTKPEIQSTELDPLYAPLLQAAVLLREKIESDHRIKIEDIKRETANQTEGMYNKLTDARQEINLLTVKNDSLIEKLKHKIDQIHQDYDQQLNNLQQKLNFQQSQLQEKLLALESENINLEVSFKEKSEKLLRTEHNLKLAHEELERNQKYIQELEDKNNTIQKELFENWILKKDEL